MNPTPSFLEGFKQKLKIRNAPKTQKSFFINIKDNDEVETEIETEIETKREMREDKDLANKVEIEEETSETLETSETRKPRNIQIIDKSATAAIDRDLIIKRIKEAKSMQIRGIKGEEGQKPPPPPPPPISVNQEKEEPPKMKIKIGKKRVIFDDAAVREPKMEAEMGAEKKMVIKKPKRTKIENKLNVPLKEIFINSKDIVDRLPPHEKIIKRVSNYYMNNRKIAVNKLRLLLGDIAAEGNDTKSQQKIDCDSIKNQGFELLTHQKIAREYLNLYTPYRGLLLYFSLGSGKSCTSIAIAEGMKTDKRIFIMTPASLKMNFFTELKKCGDPIFKNDQYWEFISINGHPEYVEILSKALSLPTESIKNNGGAWLVDVRKPSNVSDLNGDELKAIDNQINEMIRTKYTDLNYNGMNMRKMRELTEDFTKNPFDHSVVIIDEAHNFVSRIVNKIKKRNSISYKLYDLLMKATDVRIVMLSGTPIINYPNEIGIMYNMLRGYIKTWVFRVNVQTSKKVNKNTILEMFDKARFKTYDYVEYSGDKLTITRNPYGFINMKKPGPAKIIKTGGGGKRNSKKTTKRKLTGKNKKRTTKKSKVLPQIIGIEHLTEESENELQSEFDQEQSRELTNEINQSNQGNRIPGLDYEKDGGGGGVVGGAEDEYELFEKYNGVQLNETGNISDENFVRTVMKILKDNNIDVINNAPELILNKALPDDSDSFMNMFINQQQVTIKNKSLLQRRILGLTSYYRSAQEDLLPSFVETKSENDDTKPSVIHVEETEMSDYQFKIYSEIRKDEREQERRKKINARKQNPDEEDLFKVSSTYRIFSRAACNFVFPTPPGRPMPTRREDEVINEAKFDATPANLLQDTDNYADNEEVEEMEKIEKESASVQEESYADKIVSALAYLKDHASEYLTPDGLEIYSPKFKRILENLKDPTNNGLHLIYSQFRTIEGIGILQLILEANGFERLVVIKNEISGEWSMREPKDLSKPRFLLYTGTESAEEREILRNIYNSQWKFLPATMETQLTNIAKNNFMGGVVKIMMITASGAEGINLKNTRFVHIIEPYWHMVRLEQVIGRARRICSHQDLDKELRTVKVFLYVSSLTEEQSTSDVNKELIINDVSKLDKKTPLTTDQTLYENARIKDTINQQILLSIKESAIDCGIYESTKEPLVCYGFGTVTSNDFGSFPSLETDESNNDILNIKKEKLKLIKATINGIEYAYDQNSKMVYDLESYMRSKKTGENLLLVGRMVKRGKNYVLEPVGE